MVTGLNDVGQGPFQRVLGDQFGTLGGIPDSSGPVLSFHGSPNLNGLASCMA